MDQYVPSPLQGMPLHRRMQITKQMAEWAPGMVRMVARAWIKWVSVPKAQRLQEAAAAALQLQHLTHGAFGPYGEVSKLVRNQLWQVPVDTMLKLSRRVKQKPHPRVHMTRLHEDQASYKRHVLAGHIPYRRDCAVCLRGAARSRSKRTRIPTADSFTLALDLAGPYEPGVCEDEEVAGRARRFLIGVYRFPTDAAGQVFWDLPQDWKAADVPAEMPCDSPPVPPNLASASQLIAEPGLHSPMSPHPAAGVAWSDDDAEGVDVGPDPWGLMPDEVVDGPKDLLVELGDDGVFPPGLLEEDAEGVPEEQEEPPDPNLLCEGENQTRTWKRQYLARVDGITMKSLVFLELLPSKSQRDVLQAFQKMLSKLKLYQCPLMLVHTDRGREFVNKAFKAFLASQAIKHSTTEADNPSSNGRAEAWIGLVKNATRKLLLQASLPSRFWPLAATHAAELCHRHQLREVGTVAKPLIPFGTGCHVKERSWRVDHRGAGTWSSRVVEGLIVSPSTHVSRGYVVLVRSPDEDDRLFVSTSVQISPPREPVEVRLADPVVPRPKPEPMNPTHRVRGKSSLVGQAPDIEEVAEDMLPIERARLVVTEGSHSWEGPIDSFLSEPAPAEAARSSGEDGEEADLHRLDRLSVKALKGLKENARQVSGVNARGKLSLQQSEALAMDMLKKPIMNRFQVGMLAVATFQKGKTHRQIDRASGQEGWVKTLGAFAHGGLYGVTNEAKFRPNFVKACNLLLTQHCQHLEEFTWTAIRLTCDSQAEQHVDVHNQVGSLSYLLPLSYFQGGRLLVNNVPHEFPADQCLVMDPKVPHGVEPFQGMRLVLTGYTPRGMGQLNIADKQFLRSLHFPLTQGVQTVYGAGVSKSTSKTPSHRVLGVRGVQDVSEMHHANSASCSCALPSSDSAGWQPLVQSVVVVGLQSDTDVWATQRTIECVATLASNLNLSLVQSGLCPEVAEVQQNLLDMRLLLRGEIQAFLPKPSDLGGRCGANVLDGEAEISAKPTKPMIGMIGLKGERSIEGWINQLEQEVLNVETILGCKGIGGSAKCRVERLKRVTQELNEAKTGWLDQVTMRICSVAVCEDSEPWEQWQAEPSAIMLQPKTLTIQEVYDDLQAWIPPLADEIKALTETHGAVEIITVEDVARLGGRICGGNNSIQASARAETSGCQEEGKDRMWKLFGSQWEKQRRYDILIFSSHGQGVREEESLRQWAGQRRSPHTSQIFGRAAVVECAVY